MWFSHKAFFVLVTNTHTHTHTCMLTHTGWRVLNNLLFNMTIDLQFAHTHCTWLLELRVLQHEHISSCLCIFRLHEKKSWGSLHMQRKGRPSNTVAFLTSATFWFKEMQGLFLLWVIRLCLKCPTLFLYLRVLIPFISQVSIQRILPELSPTIWYSCWYYQFPNQPNFPPWG